jgi:16S rRNA G966 N2-methylase RsmD
LIAGAWLSPSAVVVLEEAENAEVPDVAGLTLVDNRVYGAARVRIYRAV